MVTLLTGVLSAFLVNDAICLVMAPIVVQVTRAMKRDPLPYLVATATASNCGSVATITGNPQNMQEGPAEQGRLGRRNSGKEGDRQRDAGETRLQHLAFVRMPAQQFRPQFGFAREFLRVDDAHHRDDRDEAERRHRRQRKGKRRVGNPRQCADDH
jgi:Citrate transporter